MKCPRCGKDDDKVVDSRASAEGTVIRRRRECLACAMRFTTYERVEESPLRVVKKNGDRVPFDRDKIRAGMLRACEKLPVPVDHIEDAAARVETSCQAEFDREVPSSVIGSAVMEELRRLHHVAYVRFASVYREFKDVQQFMHELQSILAGQAAADGALTGRADGATDGVLLDGATHGADPEAPGECSHRSLGVGRLTPAPSAIGWARRAAGGRGRARCRRFKLHGAAGHAGARARRGRARARL
ncbi:MAG: transcriptional regulator NrdR [Planctomycetota bacterium]